MLEAWTPPTLAYRSTLSKAACFTEAPITWGLQLSNRNLIGSIVQLKNLRLREAKRFTQGHTAHMEEVEFNPKLWIQSSLSFLFKKTASPLVHMDLHIKKGGDSYIWYKDSSLRHCFPCKNTLEIKTEVKVQIWFEDYTFILTPKGM